LAAAAGTVAIRLVRGVRVTASAVARVLYVCLLLVVAALGVVGVALSLFGGGGLRRRLVLGGAGLYTLRWMAMLGKRMPGRLRLGGYSGGRKAAAPTARTGPNGPGEEEPDGERGSLSAIEESIRKEMKSRAAGTTTVGPSPEAARVIQEIIRRRMQYEPLEQIRKELGLSRGTVRSVVESFRL
jgi:hypothetical protein